MILGQRIRGHLFEEKTSFPLPFALDKLCSMGGVLCNPAFVAKKKMRAVRRHLSLWCQTVSVIVSSTQYSSFSCDIHILTFFLIRFWFTFFCLPLWFVVRSTSSVYGPWTSADRGLFGVHPTVGCCNRVPEATGPAPRTARSLEMLTPLLFTPQDLSRFAAIAISPIARNRRGTRPPQPPLGPRSSAKAIGEVAFVRRLLGCTECGW